MSASRRRARGVPWPVISLTAALVIGGFLRFWQLTNKSLFIDEGFSFNIASAPLRVIPDLVIRTDVHPPLFYLAAHAALVTVHWPFEEYRLLIAPFGLLTIVAAWALARRLFGDLTAGFVAIIVATEPTLVAFDRLFRMYAPLAALTTTAWWMLCVAIEEKGPKRTAAWAAFGVIAITLPYLHYLGALVVASAAAFALTRLRTAWPALVFAGLSFAAFAPWLPVVARKYPIVAAVDAAERTHFFWQGAVGAAFGGDFMPVGLLHGTFNGEVLLSVFVIAMVAGGIWMARSAVLSFWASPMLLQIVLALFTSKNFTVPRYFVYMVPAASAAIGVLLAGLVRSHARALGIGLGAALLLFNGISLADMLLIPEYQTPDWYATDLLLAQRERPSDAMIFVQGMPYLILGRYATVRGHPSYAVDVARQVPDVLKWIDSKPQRRIWYIDNQADYADPRSVILRHLHSTRPALASWIQPHVHPENVVYIALFGTRGTRLHK